MTATGRDSGVRVLGATVLGAMVRGAMVRGAKVLGAMVLDADALWHLSTLAPLAPWHHCT